MTQNEHIRSLRGKHRGKPIFCLGTAPHINKLDLELLRNQCTIACNQHVLSAAKLNFDYICFQRMSRIEPFRDALKDNNSTYIIPDTLSGDIAELLDDDVRERTLAIKTRFTSRGHADFFSFDLQDCVYAGDILAMQIQLAVWMGGNPIYVLGVDGQFENVENAFFDHTEIGEGDVEQGNQYWFPDLKDWLEKTKNLLWARQIRLYNASGEHSALDVLPRTRLMAAVGSPTIAVSSRTFSTDSYLVSELKRYFPNVVVNTAKDKLEGDRFVDFLQSADGLILGTEPLTAEVIKALPCLRSVAKFGVGLNNVDFLAARRHDVEVAYRKGVNSDSVAELVLAFTLMNLRNVDQSMTAYRQQKWSKLRGLEIGESTVGIIGYGHVGRVVARKFAALGVARLLVNDLIEFDTEPPIEFVPMDYLLSESDVVTMHVSMESHNYHMVNADFFDKMKDSAYFINTSRGEVVDEAALATALSEQRIAGAALDVYEHEPTPNPVLAEAPNLLTTCHIAGSSRRAINNMGWSAIEGILNLFNKEVL